MDKTIKNLPLVNSASRRNFLKLTGAAGVAAAFASTLAACGSPAATTTGAAGTTAPINKDLIIEAGISYALSTGFDPMTSSGATPVAANMHIFEGLVDLHPATREPYNALAAADPKKVNATTYQVTLRDGAKFHDGTPVTADDVVFSFNRVMDPANKSLFAQFIPFIEDVKAVDAEPRSSSRSSTPSRASARASPWSRSSPRRSPIPAGRNSSRPSTPSPVGSGPYKLISAVKDDKIVFEPTADYNGPMPARPRA